MYKLSDVIQSEFLSEIQAVSMGKLFTTLLLAFLLGIFVVVIYRLTYHGVLFSWNFALSLILLSLITASVILAVSSNVVLSLGMVGALSIVRFRTAVKDPLDTIFMFWAIAVGIMTGAGYITVAIAAALVTGVLFLISTFLRQSLTSRSYMVMIRYDPAQPAVKRELDRLKHYRMRSETLSGEEQELVLETRLNNRALREAEALRDTPGVHRVDIVAYNSDTFL